MILKECRKHEAILTDLNMPNVDGTTFLEHVPKETSVIVMSAYLDRPEFEAASGSGHRHRFFCKLRTDYPPRCAMPY